MNKEEMELIDELIIQSITRDEFLDRFPVDLRVNKNYLFETLQKAITNKDAEELEAVSTLIGMFDNYTKYINILCFLILEKWHYMHENIADKFQILKMPETVDCLYQAAISKFEYLDFDDSYALARRCIHALGDINTDKAKEKLKLLAKSDNKIIKKSALHQLNRKD